MTMAVNALYYFLKFYTSVYFFFQKNIWTPLYNARALVYVHKITKIDEYDLDTMEKRVVYGTFYPIDYICHLLGSKAYTGGLTEFIAVKEHCVYNIEYGNGSCELIRATNTNTSANAFATFPHYHGLRSKAYLFAGIHTTNNGHDKADITELMNKYTHTQETPLVNIDEFVRLLFMMNEITMDDYHEILESKAVLTLVTCDDQLNVYTKTGQDMVAF